jgi:methionyl-tRNA formyltransferase
MNVVFMGTPDFAASALKRLIRSKNRVLAVVTQPDRPKGRGRRIALSPVKEEALKNNLPCFQPERPRVPEFVERVRNLEPEAIIVSAYGHIISKDILDIPPYGCINIHASLLPRYRGAAPINWAIIRGETKTGITTMLMDEKMDTGDILMQREVPISDTCTAGELHDILAPLGAELLIETIEGLENGSVKPVPQDDSKATYAPKLKKEDGLIDWQKSAKEIYDFIRGMNPWPGAYTSLRKKMLKIWTAKTEKRDGTTGRAGEIIGVSEEKVVVRAGKGSVGLLEVQSEGGKRLLIKDFIHGHPLGRGNVMGIEEG